MNKYIFLAVCSLAFIACEQGDDDRLAQAQACLDRATSTTATDCEQMVSGIAGPAAAVIRCSANFITQGITGARFANAFSDLKDPPSGVNATAAMASYLTFTVGADDAARSAAAQTCLTNCQATGLAGMIMFASFAATATELSMGLGITPGTPPDPSQFEGNIANCVSATPPCSDTSIAAAVSAISTSYCNASGGTSNAEFCSIVNDAADEGSAAAIAARLRDLMDN